MPIQFACIHCDQRLSVSQKKVGARVNCPQCKTSLVVPTEAEAATILEERRRRRDGEGQVEGESPEDHPFSQFAVFDDEPEIVYENEMESVAPANQQKQEGVVDPTRLAVPRYLIYVQGGLLVGVALFSFTLGILAGGAFGPSAGGAPVETGPHVVNGALYFKGNGETHPPDVDALVLILPVNAKPEVRPPIEGIRPQDPPPKADNQALQALRQIGADYARTSADGTFQLNVPRGGRYYLLFISQERKRGENQTLDPAMLAHLGGYLEDPAGLIGNRAYVWQTESVRSNLTKTHIFP